MLGWLVGWLVGWSQPSPCYLLCSFCPSYALGVVEMDDAMTACGETVGHHQRLKFHVKEDKEEWDAMFDRWVGILDYNWGHRFH